MKKYVMRKEYEGTYLGDLINEYNNFIDNPRYFDNAYLYLKSLRMEIADIRKAFYKK